MSDSLEHYLAVNKSEEWEKALFEEESRTRIAAYEILNEWKVALEDSSETVRLLAYRVMSPLLSEEGKKTLGEKAIKDEGHEVQLWGYQILNTPDQWKKCSCHKTSDWLSRIGKTIMKHILNIRGDK